MLLAMGCELAQGYAISRPMPSSDIANWLCNYQASKAWIAFAENSFSSKELKLEIFKLALNQWVNVFEKNIQSIPESIKQWPIMSKTHSHTGTWIKRARKEALLKKSYLNNLTQEHDAIFSIARELKEKYQSGDVNLARDGLKELRKAFETTKNILQEVNL